MIKSILIWIRKLSSTFFHRFGIHCATHQIRLILISGLVITSLFYPALGIYTSSSWKPPSGLIQQFLGYVFSPDIRSLTFFKDDLRDIWAGHEALRIRDDPVARAKCGRERTVRVERLLVTSNTLDSDAGVINKSTLLSALNLENVLKDHIASMSLNCLSSSPGCVFLSPLEFWAHDEQVLLSDEDLLKTIRTDINSTFFALPLENSLVFAGRETVDPHEASLDFASFLAFTFFFNEDDCNGLTGHNAWIRALRESVSSVGDLIVKSQEPLLLALEFDPEMNYSRSVSLITITLYISYIVFFIYFSGSMRRMDTVHSRVGLCFTGLVEILVSTITSLSVCAIFGLRITLVPWGIFPIVIVFVGAENMFRLVDEVVKTPTTLPVKERIGLGLSRAGTSNTLKVVSYNTILGIIGFFAQGAIRQFCVFAIVVLVAHWFLIHTFFVAVLSIDIQRLELDDLLRQDTSLGSSVVERKSDVDLARNASHSLKLVDGIRQVTRGRVARNVSLLLLLAIAATLYLSTLPSPVVQTTKEVYPPGTRASMLRVKETQAKLEAHSAAHQLWRTFNPENDRLVHLRIEAPSIAVFDRLQYDSSEVKHRVRRSLWTARTLRPLLWISKVLVLPIGTTLSCLYVLLLYLLKGTDKLESHHETATPETEPLQGLLEGQPLFKTLPRTFATDVNLLASNIDGTVVATVSTDGEIFVWLTSLHRFIKLEPDKWSSRSMSRATFFYGPTAIALDTQGIYCVVGTMTGVLGVWMLRHDHAQPLCQLAVDHYSSSVVQVMIVTDNLGSSVGTQHFGTLNQSDKESVPTVYAMHSNGRVVKWVDGSPIILQPQASVATKAMFVETPAPRNLYICFFTDTGGLELIRHDQGQDKYNSITLQVGSSADLVINAHVCPIEIENSTHLIVAAATQSGITTLWDASTGDCISTLRNTFDTPNNIRLVSIPSRACPQCGEVPLCTFAFLYSVGHIVYIDRATLAGRCSCPLSQPLLSKTNTKDIVIGKRSRSGSFVSSSGNEAFIRSRVHQTGVTNEIHRSDNTLFPVSGHGVHSRRGSDKEISRRSTDRFDRAAFGTFDDIGDSDEPMGFHTEPLIFKQWRNFRLVRIKEATCERAGWGLLGYKVLGLRRKRRYRRSLSGELPTTCLRDTHRTYLSSSVRDRWEAWIVDLTRPDDAIHISSLMDFTTPPEADGQTNSAGNKTIPALSFTRLSPIIIHGSICLAGFGNTIGLIEFES